jgi:hypothetical protein
LVLAGTDTIVTLNVFLWSILCDLMGIFQSEQGDLSQPVPYVIAVCVGLHRYVCVQLLLKQLYLWMGAGLSCKSREFPQKCRQGLLESGG